MSDIDRQISISSGWVAGPSAGLAMMAAPEYLHLHPIGTAICFWIGIVVFCLSVGHVLYAQFRNKKESNLTGPFLLILFGMTAFFAGVIWRFWPSGLDTQHIAAEKNEKLKLNTEYSAAFNSSAFIDCAVGSWEEAKIIPNDTNVIFLGSFVASAFGNTVFSFGLATGPVVNSQHSQPASSAFPIKCTISFYGYSPIFNFEISPQLLLYKPVRGPQTVSNERYPYLKIPVSPLRIKQVEKNKKYIFYVYSFDVDAYISMSLPEKFSFATSEDSVRHEGRVLKSDAPYDAAFAYPQIEKPK